MLMAHEALTFHLSYTGLELLCHLLYLRLRNQRLWPFSCLYLSHKRTTFVNSIATLFQHVFKKCGICVFLFHLNFTLKDSHVNRIAY